MTATLRLFGGLNILVGLALASLYHESCKLVGVLKPSPVWPLQTVGAVTALVGVGYLLAARNPGRFRRFLLSAFVFHATVEIWLTSDTSATHRNIRISLFVVLVAVCYLIPLAAIIFSLSKNQPTDTRRYRAAARSIGFVAMLLVILLPPSWALAHAMASASTRWHNAHRPAKWTPLTANLPASVAEEFEFAPVDCWPALRFQDPTFACEMPDGSGRMIVLERVGRIRVFPKNIVKSGKPDVLLDISNRTINVVGKAEDGLLGLAFHPQFGDAKSAHRGEFFVRYTSNAGGIRSNRLSRFTLAENAKQADEKSEVILIEMPETTTIHKGGGLQFGPDGFLYVTFGTDARHFPHTHTQKINYGLWAGVLRLDVDCRGGKISHAPLRQPSVGHTANYFIPNDNPFVGQQSALEEFYSIGLRNPWRLSIDQQTGRVWVGDVGDRRREEINICTPGSNHQYDYLEGTLPVSTYTNNPPQKPENFIGIESPPAFEYPHDGTNRCVIGGYVYRGKKLPELVGKYVYADQCGRVYALTVDDTGKVLSNELIAVVRTSGLGISSFGVDEDGELYICWIRDLATPNSQVLRLERAIHNPKPQLPERLSQTGLFRDLKTLEPNPSLIPYEINSPLWSDRALKKRWIGLPSEEKIIGDASGRWTFPVGAVLLKHFDLPMDERAAAYANQGEAKTRRLETRILVRDNLGGVYGASYRWNADETDAYLVNFSTTEEIEYFDREGNAKKQTWAFPGRLDCLSCHNTASPGVLGFNARQLNREIRSQGLNENQLVKFSAAGMLALDRSDAELPNLPKLSALDDTTQSVEHRVRSYLDSNCSHCHAPGGRAALWDARIETPLVRGQIVDGAAITHRGDDARARVVKPGDLDWSFLYIRMASNEPALRMPPLARHVVHEDAVALVKQWISSLLADHTVELSAPGTEKKDLVNPEYEDVGDDNR
jgi:uncharacterized repeat protein (TIGR03806 family)